MQNHQKLFSLEAERKQITLRLWVPQWGEELKKGIITSKIEHHAVLNTCKYLEEKLGFHVTYLDVNREGVISLEELRQALNEDTALLTLMYGNNEVGSLQPIREAAALAYEYGAKVHTDAVQALGMENIDVTDLNVDLLSISAHKINGPKGSGFLYVKEGTHLEPHLHGGEQERKKRAGTHNVPAIAGLGRACQLASEHRQKTKKRYFEFKQLLVEELKERKVDFKVNGDISNSLPHIINLSFPGVNVEQLLMNLDLDGLAVSSGSACTAGSLEPSHVLSAMYGNGATETMNSVRFSFGLYNDKKEIEKAAEIVAKVTGRLNK